MPKDAPSNGGAALEEVPMGPRRWVSEMQAKLHRWAAADPGRRFDDLVNSVYDPATLIVAFDRVAGNTGARTAGVDGLTVADVEQRMGVAGFLDDLRAQLKTGTFRPLPVRERTIPKPGGSGWVAVRAGGVSGCRRAGVGPPARVGHPEVLGHLRAVFKDPATLFEAELLDVVG
jgi:RNA-directed DNA polymerase